MTEYSAPRTNHTRFDELSIVEFLNHSGRPVRNKSRQCRQREQLKSQMTWNSEVLDAIINCPYSSSTRLVLVFFLSKCSINVDHTVQVTYEEIANTMGLGLNTVARAMDSILNSNCSPSTKLRLIKTKNEGETRYTLRLETGDRSPVSS